MPWSGPSDLVELVKAEHCSCEEGGHCHTYKKGACRSVYKKEDVEGLLSVNIGWLGAVLIGNCLYNEAEEDSYPYPVGTSETCGIEKREGCKKGTSESHKRGKGEFPFTSEGIYHHGSPDLVTREGKDHRLTSLYKHKED